MSLLKQIEDKGAVLEWSPISAQPNLIALGTKDTSGVGFDDYGGELEIHRLDLKNLHTPTTKLLGKARANSRFSSLAWSQMALHRNDLPHGLIAGGMIDGFVHIWDPSRLSLDASDDSEALIASVEQHQGGIRGLQFNPHKESSHLLASGGSDGEVFVMSLERPDVPNVFVPAPPPNSAKHSAEISKVAWNTQVAYILASAAVNGSTYVWDLRQKKAWCELRDPTGGLVADIAWNPDQGLNIITASGDDKNPVLKLWDLRSSTSLPLATLQGHTEGILSISWCPTDPSLVLSCGKDNNTILWDLFQLQPVFNLPSDSGHGDGTENKNVFGGLATSAGQRRSHVSWSPCLPAVVGACSFDRRIQFYSFSGVKSKLGRAPKWLRRPVGAMFGFGGKLVSFSPGSSATTSQVLVSQVIEDPVLATASDSFHSYLKSKDFKSFCEIKSSSSPTPHEREVWGLLRVIYFESHPREELQKFLGYSSENISAVVETYVQSNNSEASVVVNRAPEVGSSEVAEPIVGKALVAGDFASAVNCCLKAGLFAEALLIASRDPALWQSTQEAYFKLHKTSSFLTILHSIIKHDLDSYVLKSDLRKWRETLALVSTYSKSEEFPILCESLGYRLEKEISDFKSANLCYLCAMNTARVVSFWVSELKRAHESFGRIDTIALQHFVEKVIVLTSNNPSLDLGQDTAAIFAEYGELLANEGKIEFAQLYIRGSSQRESILADRLFHAGRIAPGSKPPAFPFTKVSVSQENPTQPVAGSFNVRPVTKAVNNPQSGAPLTTAVSSGATKPSASAPTPAVSAPQVAPLPAGWIELIDPNSRRPYYVNQVTSVSQWDRPSVPQVVPLPAVPENISSQAFKHVGYPQQGDGMHAHAQPAHTQPSISTEPKPAIPSVFPTSTKPSQPTPFIQASPLIPAATFPQAVPSTAPVPVAALTPVAHEKPVMGNGVTSSEAINSLGDIIGQIATNLNAAEKRQMTAVTQSYTHLQEMLSGGQVSADVLVKIESLVHELRNRNFPAASAIQTDLVNTVWMQHKEWLKGIKILIQLASKKN